MDYFSEKQLLAFRRGVARATLGSMKASLIALLFLAGLRTANAAPVNDYPTSARADYVVGCLAANGFQHDRLEACACSIDVIADRMTFDQYEDASTIMSMQQASVGPRGGLFRDTPVAKESLERLRRAEAEANLRCGG